MSAQPETVRLWLSLLKARCAGLKLKVAAHALHAWMNTLIGSLEVK
jgi:hypothetical protein